MIRAVWNGTVLKLRRREPYGGRQSTTFRPSRCTASTPNRKPDHVGICPWGGSGPLLTSSDGPLWSG